MIPVLEPTHEALRRAADALRQGRLVGMPTETVYGLAGHALDPIALARIFEVKRRPFFDPLILHVADETRARALWETVPPDAVLLMRDFWPGPLTLVLPKAPNVPDLATSGLPSVAVRVPAHPLAQALLREADIPLAAPSANPFGALSPTRAEHVARAFAEGIDCVLDGGPCAVGVESTVVGWEGGEPVLLRAGGVPVEALAKVLGKRPGRPAESAADAPQVSPGALPWHYAPRTPLRLLEETMTMTPEDRRGEGLVWFGSGMPEGFARAENLSPAGDAREAATNLFAALHRLDTAGLRVIRAALLPDEGLGLAVNDRLRKAAAKGDD